jgi:hypothetical protein
MLASVRAFLSELIDYAGLFPPAKLPLDEALRKYAEYRQGPDAWMLGRFIVPAAQLAEVSRVGGELLAQGPPWAFSVLGGGGNTVAEFLEGVRADLASIDGFRQRHPGRAGVAVYELKFPVALRAAPESEQAHLFHDTLNPLLDSDDSGRLQVYCELSPGPAARHGTLPTVLQVLKRGLKMRCGGLEAAAFPSPEQVALVLYLCRKLDRPFKATAGLHHPLRHTDTGLNVKMHGFINLFGAALLAHQQQLSAEQIQAVLEDEDSGHFVFEEQQFRWKDLAIAVEQIQHGREAFATSFGSCSFDEPRDDLRALGLLP